MFPRKCRHPLPASEPNLFEPLPSRPTWENLPEEVRLEARALLVQILRQLRPTHGNLSQEVADE